MVTPDKQKVRDNLLWSIEDFADFDRSVRQWRGEDPNVRRSYDEDIALFFQTYQAERFAREGCEELGFARAECAAFKSFVQALSQFDDSVRIAGVVDSETVIKNPRWRQIAAAAADLLQTLRGPGQ